MSARVRSEPPASVPRDGAARADEPPDGGLAQAALEAAPDPMILADAAGRVLAANAAARRVLPGADAGRRLAEVWRGDTLPLLVRALSAAAGGESGGFEARIADTPPLWWDCAVAPLPGRAGTVLLTARDVTARVAAQGALAHARARLDALTQTPRAMVWIMRADGTLVFTNEHWRTFCGIDGEGVGAAVWMQRIHPDDRARVGDVLLTALHGAETHEAVFRARRCDGAWRWVRRIAMPVRDTAGRVIEWAGFTTDITDHRAAEEQSRLLRQMADNSPNFVSIADADGRLSYINPAGRALVGIEPDADITGMRFDDYIAPDSLALFREQMMPTAREQGIWEGEMRLLNPRTGALIDIHRITLGLRDETGRHVGYATTTRDITEAKRATAALAASEARFRGLVAAMPQIAFIAGADGRIAFHNRRWADYTGSEAVGRRWQERLHPDDRAAAEAAWRRSIASGETYTIEHRLMAADGSARCFLTRAVPLADSADSVAQWLATATDISDIVAAREASARSNAELESLVAERTRALTDAARELAQEMQRRDEMQAILLQTRKLEALGQLTGGVAHDFNNILAAILGSYNLIRRRTDSSAVLDLVTRGEQAAERAGTLVRQLLTFARRQELRPQALDPAAIIAEADGLITHTVGRRIRRVIDVPPGTWPVLADPQQLEVALLNLAVNARDAMPAGGTLTIAARNLPPEERPASLPARDFVAIAVRDTGHGMPPAVIARATEPFFTTKDPGKGTGLGLAMVHGFTEQSGGALHIHSQEGKGTTVELILARADQDIIAAPSDGAPTLDQALHGDAMVLVVEDDEQVRSITAGLLRDFGYTVVEARNTEVALALVHTLDRLDLVITDVIMPGADGTVLAARLRRERPDLPVLFVTGHAIDPVLAEETVLAKPFSRDALGAAVLRGLGRSVLLAPAVAEEPPLLVRIRAPALRALYFNWVKQGGARGLPTPGAIDPAAFGLREHAYLLSVNAAGEASEMRFLAAGQALVARLGRDLVGEPVNARPGDEAVLGAMEAAFQRCRRDRAPVYQFLSFDFGDGAPVQFERLLLPLSEDGGSITHLLGAVLFDAGAATT